MIMKYVPGYISVTKENFTKLFLDMNSELVDNDTDISFCYAYKVKSSDTNVVFRCSAGIRNMLLGCRSGVRMGHKICEVSDYINPRRCSICHSLNHQKAHCNGTSPLCSHCGEKHLKKNCEYVDNTDHQKCVICLSSEEPKIKSQSSSHSSLSPKCPCYQRQQQYLIQRIN